MIKKILSKGKTFAILLDVKDIAEGAHSITHSKGALQMLMMKRKAGHVVKKHMHKRISKSTTQPQEGIVVVKGAVRAIIYDRKGKKVGACSVTAGQCLLILDGAHKVEMTKSSLIYEFKTGPYVEDKIYLS